jgi:hypothetical protein
MDDYDQANIVRFVPGEYVSAALHTLPHAATSVEEVRETLIDVPALNRVRFTCRRLTVRKGRTRRWFWTAERAVEE